MAPRVYISGALTNVADPDGTKAFYEALANTCREAGLDVYLPHRHSDPQQRPDLTPREVFDRDKREVLASDLLIAYVGVPSLGVGMEIAYAESAGMPIILLGEQGRRISRFPLGVPYVVEVIRFHDFEEALRLLHDCLRSVRVQRWLSTSTSNAACQSDGTVSDCPDRRLGE